MATEQLFPLPLPSSASAAATSTRSHRRQGPDRKPSPTYHSWRGMTQRCLNPHHVKYSNYGGRGITIDPRWTGKGGFANFLADMGVRPEGMTLDRRDPDGPYCKDNCKWSDDSEQNFNRRWYFRRQGRNGRFVGSEDQEDGTEEGNTEFDF